MARFARHFRHGEAQAQLWRGRAAWLGGRHHRALHLWRRAIALGERLGMPLQAGRAHLEIGRRLPQDSPERRRHLERAIAVLGGIGAVFEVEQARAALGSPS